MNHDAWRTLGEMQYLNHTGESLEYYVRLFALSGRPVTNAEFDHGVTGDKLGRIHDFDEVAFRAGWNDARETARDVLSNLGVNHPAESYFSE